MSALVIYFFFGLLAFAVPVAHALVMATGAAVYLDGNVSLNLLVTQMFQQTQSFPMLALPFFILAGSLMMSGKLGDRLIEFATELVQRRRGGLAKTTVIGSVIFGGVSGSAVSDATALGSVLIPWQIKSGYPPNFCSAVNSCASTIAVLIPPSIPMILFGLVSNASVGELFIAGVLPGLVLAGGFISVINMRAKQLDLPFHRPPFDWPKFRSLLFYAMPALIMPVMILGFLRFGIATPTEVSVMACVYAILAGLLIYRDMTFKRFWNAMVGAGLATGVVMLIIMASAVFGWILTYDQMPQRFATWALETLGNKYLIVLAMNMVMLVAGMFIDMPAAILLLGPIFVPLWTTLGLDPVQLGIVMTLNLAVGLYTPPVGTTLWISSAVARVTLPETLSELWPFFAVGIGTTLLFSYVPWLIWY
jgi:tripartite ATP-independent transporter DctM subunit